MRYIYILNDVLIEILDSTSLKYMVTNVILNCQFLCVLCD